MVNTFGSPRILVHPVSLWVLIAGILAGVFVKYVVFHFCPLVPYAEDISTVPYMFMTIMILHLVVIWFKKA
jgi:hypothetical protein